MTIQYKTLYQYAYVFSLATMLSRRPFTLALSDTVKREIKELCSEHEYQFIVRSVFNVKSIANNIWSPNSIMYTFMLTEVIPDVE